MKITLLTVVISFFSLSISGELAIADHSGNDRPTDNHVELAEVNTPKHLVIVAGGPSHSTGTHEHRAGVLIMERCLANVPDIEVSTHFGGWPSDDSAFESADAVHLFMDGGGRHPVVQEDRLQVIRQHIDNGMSFGAMHYAVEVPADNGGEQFKKWIGGHYETHFSANPIWEASFENLSNHPVMKGVEPFTVEDEWYFSIRFRPDMVGVTPLLVAIPSDDTRDGPYVHPQGPYDHIVERKGESEVLSWVVEREDGGRGFGFTGGHFHNNWGNDGFRTYVLNALVWLAGAEVPDNGVSCQITEADLQENLDE